MYIRLHCPRCQAPIFARPQARTTCLGCGHSWTETDLHLGVSITATPGVDTTAFTVIPRAKRILQEQQTARPKRRRPRASSQRGMDTNALASLIFGSLGCVMACFWPIGLLCSTAGVIVGFIARNSHSRGPATVGFVLSAGSFIVGFGFMLVSITDIAVHGTSRTTEMKPRPFFR